MQINTRTKTRTKRVSHQSLRDLKLACHGYLYKGILKLIQVLFWDLCYRYASSWILKSFSYPYGQTSNPDPSRVNPIAWWRKKKKKKTKLWDTSQRRVNGKGENACPHIMSAYLCPHSFDRYRPPFSLSKVRVKGLSYPFYFTRMCVTDTDINVRPWYHTCSL